MIKFLDELDALNLSPDQYVICGSAILAAKGIRENNDLDVVVTPEVFEELAKTHRVNEKDIITINNIELSYFWRPNHLSAKQLIAQAQEIKGRKYMNLEFVYTWKKQAKREKDKKDILLIEEYKAKGGR